MKIEDDVFILIIFIVLMISLILLHHYETKTLINSMKIYCEEAGERTDELWEEVFNE